MLGFLGYTLEAGIIFAVLAAIYRYLYSGISYHKWERGFLLASVALSYALPLMKVRFYTSPTASRPQDSIVDIVSRYPVDVVTLSHERTFASGFDRFMDSQIFDNIVAVVFAIYIAGVAVKMVSYIGGIRKILSLRRGSPAILPGGIRMYKTELDTVAFSFFRNIFLGSRSRQLSPAELDVVVAHETNHIRGLHSLDTLVFGLYSVLQWINPMVGVARRASREVCENIADACASGSENATEYSRLILRLGMQNRSGQHQPAESSGALLRRIGQLLSHDGSKLRRLRFICTLPVMALMMAAYLILAGMANPISAGLEVPVHGKYSITAGFFENQRIMDSDGILYSASHRQMDMRADTAAVILSPANCMVSGISNSELAMECGRLTIIIGGISPERLHKGDTITKGQMIGRPWAGHQMFLKVLDCGTPVNPELVFNF